MVDGFSAQYGAAASGASGSSYAYNGDGLRAAKVLGDGSTAGFTWDPSGGLPQLLSDGTTSYIYGPDGLPLEQIDAGGGVTWYHHDQLGSTRTLTSSTGAVVGTATYDPYGHLSASTGTLSSFGFSGQYTDAETGLVYLRTRYYDPGTSQFLTVDHAIRSPGLATAMSTAPRSTVPILWACASCSALSLSLTSPVGFSMS